MRTLKDITQNTITHNESWTDYLQEQYIKPLEAIGFTFKGIGNMDDGEYRGIHTLIFDAENIPDKMPSEAVVETIKGLMDDDDNQPMSQFSLFYGTLWIYIPYTS